MLFVNNKYILREKGWERQIKKERAEEMKGNKVETE
jgi:hypothetical protein